jgi:hypothetical protein
MARALTEESRAEQLGHHTISSEPPHKSTCARCGGLMMTDFYMDLLFCIGETEFAAQRCVQCGEIVDPVILRNRGFKQEPVTAQPAGKMVPNSRVTNGRGGFALQTHGQALAVREDSKARPNRSRRIGSTMKPDDHSRDTEAGFFSQSWRAPQLNMAPPAEVDRLLSTPRRGLSAR